MNEWCFHGIALKMDNKKFIVYRPAILLAIETSYLATVKQCMFLYCSLSSWKRAVGRRDAVFNLGIKRLLCDDNEEDESF